MLQAHELCKNDRQAPLIPFSRWKGGIFQQNTQAIDIDKYV